jgi:Zn-finger nucleic acid-binding protein
MKCPVCHELMMVLELEKVEIDYCVLCRGIWLDEGELEMLLESAGQKNRFLKSLSPKSLLTDARAIMAYGSTGASCHRHWQGADCRKIIKFTGCWNRYLPKGMLNKSRDQ